MKSHSQTIAILAVLICALGLIFLGCKGEDGAQGPQGPGPSDLNTYMGDSENSCGHCHSDVVAEWQTAKHSRAYADLVTSGMTGNNYCVQCHTTGFDDEWVAGPPPARTSTGVNQRGFDDEPRTATQNVQCEACHGPMGPSLNHEPVLEKAITGEQCGRCHHSYEDYTESGHGTAMERAGGQADFYAEFGRSSCWNCHTNEGFTGQTPTAATVHQVTCMTCHDPHKAANDSTSQLRADKLTADTLLFKGPSLTGADTTNFVFSDWRKGQLCARCHHARTTLSSMRTQINTGGARPGPHHSPQADMLAGWGSYAPVSDVTIEHNSPHTRNNVADMCVTCHVSPREHGDPYHTFEASLAVCQRCHSGAANFDVGGTQTEIQGLLDQLRAMLPANLDTTSNAAGWNLHKREAGYAYFFVLNDGSKGVHNAPYARSLLTNAIHYLQLNP